MRVLHLAAGNLFGGVETYLITLAKLRHLCPEMEPEFGLCFSGRLRDELTATGVPVHDLDAVRISRPWTVLRARSRLQRLVRQQSFDAVMVHSSWPHAVFAPVVRRSGVRLIHAVHGEIDHRHWLNRWAARTPPDAVIANSNFIVQSATNLFPRVPVQIMYYPVSQPNVDRDDVRCTIRRELSTAPKTVVILQASRLEPWKGQFLHVEALGKLKEFSGWKAWFAGGPQMAGEAEYLAELERRAKDAGIVDRICFLGQRKDVPHLMAAADIFCQPNSGPEPFGIVFVEALHAGLPVVTSNFGGASEIVIPDCGVLTLPGDAAAVAEALRELIADPERRRTLGEAGPSRAAELCDPARQLAKLAEIIFSPIGV